MLYVDVTMNVTFSGLRKPPTTPFNPDNANASADDDTVLIQRARPPSRQVYKNRHY